MSKDTKGHNFDTNFVCTRCGMSRKNADDSPKQCSGVKPNKPVILEIPDD
jgi:hypothetical protein